MTDTTKEWNALYDHTRMTMRCDRCQRRIPYYDMYTEFMNMDTPDKFIALCPPCHQHVIGPK